MTRIRLTMTDSVIRNETLKMQYEFVTHPFEPLYDENSEILILGSFPSVKSREQNFYYGHPQNRFWKVLAGVYEDETPRTVDEKKVFLHKYHIALYDVIASCDIQGSSDSSIKNVVPTDLGIIFTETKISRIFVNGKKAENLYRKYQQQTTGRECMVLPSTSPANAACTLECLIRIWGEYLRVN